MLLGVSLWLVSCGQGDGYKRIVLKHPETHDVQTCDAGILRNEGSYAKCVEDYRKQGYEIWGKR